jgi:hypothetical protein
VSERTVHVRGIDAMPTRIVRVVTAVLAIATGFALGACKEEVHSADWYMAHSAEHQAKLNECKKYPSLNQSDPNCRNANEAWATLVSATQAKNAASPPTH